MYLDSNVLILVLVTNLSRSFLFADLLHCVIDLIRQTQKLRSDGLSYMKNWGGPLSPWDRSLDFLWNIGYYLKRSIQLPTYMVRIFISFSTPSVYLQDLAVIFILKTHFRTVQQNSCRVVSVESRREKTISRHVLGRSGRLLRKRSKI